MSAINKKESEILSLMYEGDKTRDASSNIRGFLFQDYVTIMCLLQKHVEYVCSEYLEDVDVFYEDGTFEFIQVKYYPKTSPSMDEISTDLYYQYLRLQMLHSGLKASPRLYIHRTQEVDKPDLNDMTGYIGFENKPKKGKAKQNKSSESETKKPKLRDTVTYSGSEESGEWLKQHVYTLKKKGEQKKALFDTMASVESLSAFLDAFKISQPKEITAYKEELMHELAQAYPNPDVDGDEENWQLILLGLAISYIQRRYTLVDPDFEQLRVKKTAFDQYMMDSTETQTEETIISYLLGTVSEVYGEIIEYNTLSDLQIAMLDQICQKTIRWIREIGSDPKGQYRLLNTLSKDTASKISLYESKRVAKRLSLMAECKDALIVFFSYLWKIMLNICQEQVKDQADIQKHPKLFDPTQYIDSSIEDYICLNFPGDNVKHSVILPSVNGRSRIVAQKIISRIVSLKEDVPKPEKWFFSNFSNHEILRGKYDYDLNMAVIKEDPTVADLEESCFFIECMNCININAGGWNIQDPCGNCIFSEKCVEEGR